MGTIFFKWGLKFLKIFEKSGEFLQNVGIFLKNWRNFSKMLGFFSKIVGIFKKSGEIFCKMWGFLGGNFGGDKWGFLIDRVGIFSQDLVATLIINS